MSVILIGARCQARFAAARDCLSTLLPRIVLGVLYRGCPRGIILTSGVSRNVRRDVGGVILSPTEFRIRLTLAMRIVANRSRSVLFASELPELTFVGPTDLRNCRPLGAVRLPDLGMAYRRRKVGAMVEEFIYGTPSENACK